MGDLEFGFEEMQGVKLGFLLIRGKQMFPLSQVFTDLLKNVPRTTVHKRMDHLNVTKHHCDLDELRQLKAIKSVAFHAAKCTLISREDVEALYFSCKSERVLRSNRRRTKSQNSQKPHRGDPEHAARSNRFWREKVWLSFHGVPPSLALSSCNLPQIYSRSIHRSFQPGVPSSCRGFRNYETAQIPGKDLEFGEKRAFFRRAEILQRKPLMEAAITSPSDPGRFHRRTRRSERHLGTTKRRYRQVLVVPSCCKPKACVSHRAVRHFPHGAHGAHGEACLHESCSSDTECSSGNDSDFGSSLSTSSGTSSSTNSRTSADDEDEEDEEDEEEDEEDEERICLSCTSEESSDVASSHSDSSSVSSRVSVQSIRFRRAAFSGLGAKAPLVLQPTFHYKSNFQHKNGNVVDVWTDKETRALSLEARTARAVDPGLDSDAIVTRNSENGLQDLKPIVPKNKEPPSCTDGSPMFHLSRRRALQHRRDHRQDKEPVVSRVQHGVLYSHSKKHAKLNCLKQSSPIKPVKIEPEDAGTRRTSLEHQHEHERVSIKVEETLDEYEYKYATQDAHETERLSIIRAEQGGITTSPPPVGTLTPRGGHGNGARVRKSHRASVWGKKSLQNVPKPSRSSGSSASKRALDRISSAAGATFSFMSHFPCPASLVISSDGDLSPAYTLKSSRSHQVPHPSHPVWRWQLGCSVVPPQVNHRFRKETH